MGLVRISRTLCRRVSALTFAEPVQYTYNPLDYARKPHEAFLERYGQSPKQVLLVGMNPGPFGMAQTGVPFGDVSLVRDWMGIQAPVGRPKAEHPKRRIQGFDCARSEVSGGRLWGWARQRFETPERFFARFFVTNYCPLVFMEATSRNRTPDKLPAGEREPLFAACDEALRAVVAQLAPSYVIGVGAFAEKRARAALADFDGVFGSILHPSPASPLANRGWAHAAERQLEQLGIQLD